MNNERILNTLRAPHISEKAARLAESNQYVFVVAPTATKADVRVAVENRQRVFTSVGGDKIRDTVPVEVSYSKCCWDTPGVRGRRSGESNRGISRYQRSRSKDYGSRTIDGVFERDRST